MQRHIVKQPVLSAFAGAAAQKLWLAIAALVAHRTLKVAAAELDALDDRTLKDIGVHRSEITSMLQDLANRTGERRRQTWPM